MVSLMCREQAIRLTRRGLWAQGLFAAAGVDVEWTDYPGGTGAMTKALNDNEIDVALLLTGEEVRRSPCLNSPVPLGSRV